MEQVVRLKEEKICLSRSFVWECVCVCVHVGDYVLMSVWVHVWCMHTVCALHKCMSVWFMQVCVWYRHMCEGVMNAYECVYDVCTWMCGYKCIWSPEQAVPPNPLLLLLSVLLFWDRVSWWTWNLSFVLGWLARKLLGPICLLSQSQSHQHSQSCPSLLCGCRKFQPKSSCFQRKRSYPLSYPPAPEVFHLIKAV